MTLQEIVNDYVSGLDAGKKIAKRPNFAQTKKARSSFYHDIHHVMDVEKNGKASDRELLFQCVFNRDRHLRGDSGDSDWHQRHQR